MIIISALFLALLALGILIPVALVILFIRWFKVLKLQQEYYTEEIRRQREDNDR